MRALFAVVLIAACSKDSPGEGGPQGTFAHVRGWGELAWGMTGEQIDAVLARQGIKPEASMVDPAIKVSVRGYSNAGWHVSLQLRDDALISVAVMRDAGSDDDVRREMAVLVQRYGPPQGDGRTWVNDTTELRAGVTNGQLILAFKRR
jgi:hypothetical protein